MKKFLTKQQRHIGKLVLKGWTSKEIAGKLFISILTVDTHRKTIWKKIGKNNFLWLEKLCRRKNHKKRNT